ncbi:MAG: hypothetical protein RIF32_19215 [Leptospirales bacterium]|jgi:hypothetical protein
METMNNAATYFEIVEQKEEYQNMVRLLLHFDERSGRFKAYSEPELHYMRKAATVCKPAHLRVFVRPLEDRIYGVVLEVRLGGGIMATAFVHEDGIAIEREERKSDPLHPVHNIVCLSDLLSGALPCPIAGDWSQDRPGEAVLELMKSDSLWLE